MRPCSRRGPSKAREIHCRHFAHVIRGGRQAQGLYIPDLRNRAGLRGENRHIGMLLVGSPPAIQCIEV